jgi:hypothetical protein
MILFEKLFPFLYKKMSNLMKLEFTALDISKNDYSSWILGAEIHLKAMNLIKTIKE